MINSSQFIIQATEDLGDYYGWDILYGDYLTIDPLGEPKKSELVLIGDKFSKWDGQQKVTGVIVYTGRSKVRPTKTMTIEAGYD